MIRALALLIVVTVQFMVWFALAQIALEWWFDWPSSVNGIVATVLALSSFVGLNFSDFEESAS